MLRSLSTPTAINRRRPRPRRHLVLAVLAKKNISSALVNNHQPQQQQQQGQQLVQHQPTTTSSSITTMRFASWLLNNKRNFTSFSPLLLSLIIPSTTTAFSTPLAFSRNLSTSTTSNEAATKLQMTSTPSSSSSAPASADSQQNNGGNKGTGTNTSTGILQSVENALENSWIKQLSSETPDNLAKSLKRGDSDEMSNENRTMRPVLNGHYVVVKPTGIKQPRLVIYSNDVASELLHLSKEQIESDEFTNWVSGNIVLKDNETWATPYALSIMGTRYTNNCPYGTGQGYGDGRAISIGELHGYELQLKGAGQTPFCRNADGRAVLRSSIREFLASEAMHYAGVSTTRALSLVVSDVDLITRPWYSDNSKSNIPFLDDPRLAEYSDEDKKKIIRQVRQNQKSDPNILVKEKAAITCRVAPSFVRIGHVDLYARRAEKASMASPVNDSSKTRWNTSTLQWSELEQIIWHACYREYKETAYDPYYEKGDIASAATVLLEQSATDISTMVANWIRVGFAQGNFNGDNCLIAGRTMDYGPFGFMEEYSPVFAKWTGSGQHFGFMNQPSAGFANYQVLVESVVPVICAYKGTDDSESVVKSFLEPAMKKFENSVDEVMRVKLGFDTDQDVADDLWGSLEPLMRNSRTDWTVFWRQLTYVVRDYPVKADSEEEDYEGMMSSLEADEESRPGSSPFYEPLDATNRQQWIEWIKQWRLALESSGSSNDDIFKRMVSNNPKYVLREWMLVDAYKLAAEGKEAELTYLYSLIRNPYDEGSKHEHNKYYRRAPDEALLAGGTAFMS